MGVTTVVKDYGTTILNAIRDNDLKTLRSIFEKHLKSDHKIAALCITDIKHKPTKKFACPLILAARQEDPSIIRYMMDRGVDPNFVHHTVYTSKRREVVTALHIAVDLGLFSTVEVLLNANADPNITDHNEETSLHIAVKKADRVMTRMLLARGADPSVLDRRGNAPLHTATLFGHLQLVKTLLKYDADVYQKGHQGAIPSHIAAREGHIHLVQVFCSRDIGNINIKIPCFRDQREKAPIHLAAENGHVETVLALIDQFNAEVNLRDSDGNTPLHCVVLNPYHPYKMRDKDYFYATAKVLIKYHVAINEKNKFGETALHLAAANHFQKIVELLLSVGANPFAENDQHLKPIDVVPEADPVTKQLLKSAMTNPRSAPLNASMLSLQRDLNYSAMGLPPAGNSRSIPMIPNGLSPRVHQNRADMSFRSDSSMSSVFINDVRARQMALQKKPHKGTLQSRTTGEGRRRDEQENEIQPYKEEDRRRKHSSRERHQRGDSSSIMGSQLSVSSLEDATRRGHRRKDRPHRSSTVDVELQNAKNERRTKKYVKEEEDEEVFEPVSSTAKPSKHQRRRTGHPVPENLKGQELDEDEENNGEERRSRSRKERKKREKQSAKDLEKSLVPYNMRNDSIFGENEGVKVHTIPGKPSLIEVQYDRGPITIAVDTQANGFDALPPYAQVEELSEADSWKVSEEEPEERKKKKHGKEKEVIYSNQEQVLEEIRRKERQNELLKRRKSIEDRETRTREEAERRREEQEEAERQARREEEQARRRAKKLLRRKQRQEQFEQEQEFEGMPTEEEPPERPFVMELPEEVLNESPYDSDSFVAEHETSRAALITATQRRLSETTESLKKRWSHDEEEVEQEEEDKTTEKQTLVTTGGLGGNRYVAEQRPKKPPRPTVSQTELEPEETTENLEKDVERAVIIVEDKRPALAEVKGQEVQGQMKVTTDVSRYQTFQTELRETTKMEFIRMEVVSADQTKSEDDKSKKSSEEELIDYDQEPRSRSRGAESPSEVIRQGLNMRVTGEVPKAFNRKERSSARSAFILAPPVGIESSSEASDSELGGSRSSLARSPALEKMSIQRHKEWSEPLKPFYSKSPSASIEDLPSQFPGSGQVPGSGQMPSGGQVPGSGRHIKGGKGKSMGSYAKPYQSFGQIETKTDALEAAILEAQQKSLEEQRSDSSVDLTRDGRRHGNELSTFSPTASTKANVNLDSPTLDSRRSHVEVSMPSQDAHLPTILGSPTKVSHQFQNVADVGFLAGPTHGQTSIIEGSVLPVVTQVKETDIVSTETDDDFFDDESFEEISEEYQVEDEAVPGESQQVPDASGDGRHLSQQPKLLGKSSGILTPPDLLQGPHSMQPTDQDLIKSAESLRSFSGDLEVYDQEPGTRKPRSRMMPPSSKGESEKVTVEYKTPSMEDSDIPIPDAKQLEPRKLDSAKDAYLPEDDEVALINSKSAKKSKKGKKAVRKNLPGKDADISTESASVAEELGGGGGLRKGKEAAGKKSKNKQKKLKKVDAIKTTDVWREAMESEPLASSETMESFPKSKGPFGVLNLQEKISGSEILASSEDIVSELPKRKKKGDKKPKNSALISELQKDFHFRQDREEAQDVTAEDISFSNNLDIVIPPIGSKWKDLSTDNSLDVSIPLVDARYFQVGDAGENKWEIIHDVSSPKKIPLNLDEIIIPGQQEFTSEDSFSPGQDQKQEAIKGERIVGRRQQRLSKQGLPEVKENADFRTTPQVTNLDDISSIEEENSFTFDIGDDESRKGETKKKLGAEKKTERNLEADDETFNWSSDIKTLDESFSEDMDLLPQEAKNRNEKVKIPVEKNKVTIDKAKKSATPGLVKPPTPQKPSHLTTSVAATKVEEEKPLPTGPKLMYPAKRQIQPMVNGVGPPVSRDPWRSYSGGVEIIDFPPTGEGIRYISEKNDTTRSGASRVLPRFPPGSIDRSRNVVLSDTEVGRDSRVGKYGRLGPVHSEAEASDLEMPVAPGPGKSYRQAALETINRRPVLSFTMRQPGHHDKSFAYMRKLYKPQTRHSVTRHLLPTAGRYGDSELFRMARRSATESEGDTDNEYSYLYDNKTGQGQMRPATSRGRGKVVTIQEGMTRGRPRYIRRRDEPPRIMEPGPVDFSKFDVVARLWMEQVDQKTVLKSETMYLSVLPEGQELPEEIIRHAKYQSALAGDSSSVPLQWVMARSRAIVQKSRAAGEPRPECGNLSGYDSDLNLFRPSSPSGRQLILFFKVGSNWLDLAWVLFDGLQGDSETIRMIKDIQLKNPDHLTDQVHDLMHRWWKKKGSDATIEELQKALDTIHLAYIHEEYFNPRSSFVPHTDTEDDLDIGEVSDADPNVSRLIQEYEVRSLNASFVADSGPATTQELNPDVVLRQLQKAKAVAPGSTAIYTRASRTSRAESRDSSFERPTPQKTAINQHSSQERLNESSGDERRQLSNPLTQRLRKGMKHETNL